MLKEYSDLFLNLMIEHEPILAIMFVQGNYPCMAGEFGIVLIPHGGRRMWWFICSKEISRTWREVWDSSYAILVFTVHSDCVMVISTQWVWEQKKVACEPRDKNDMQVWLAEVLIIIDYVEFWSVMRKIYSHTNFVCMM